MHSFEYISKQNSRLSLLRECLPILKFLNFFLNNCLTAAGAYISFRLYIYTIQPGSEPVRPAGSSQTMLSADAAGFGVMTDQQLPVYTYLSLSRAASARRYTSLTSVALLSVM